jgi:hypothetical protein
MKNSFSEGRCLQSFLVRALVYTLFVHSLSLFFVKETMAISYPINCVESYLPVYRLGDQRLQASKAEIPKVLHVHCKKYIHAFTFYNTY